MLDIRKPIALLFLILGLVLTCYGATTPDAMYKVSLTYNVNFLWGAVMALFAVAMSAWSYLRPSA